MTITQNTNIDIAQIAKLLLEGDGFAICGHTSPDGDCIGSTLAMKRMLDGLGKKSWAIVADDDFTADEFSFMPGCSDLIFAGDIHEHVNTFLAVDVPNEKRMGRYSAALAAKAENIVTIDHHESDGNTSDFRYIDPDCASCTLIVWKIAKNLKKICGDDIFTNDLMKDIATCCYSGLLTDTGRFMFQNTDEMCFTSAKEMAECGIDIAGISSALFQEKTFASLKLEALVSERMKTYCGGRIVLSWLSEADIKAANGTNADTEGCINAIRSLKGTKIACILKERSGAVRGSLRSKDDTNVAEIAKEFGGGGHKAAAGFTLDCTLDEAIELVSKRLCAIRFNQTNS